MASSDNPFDLGFNPYESPRGVSTPTAGPAWSPPSTFRPAHTLALVSCVFLAMMVLTNLTGIVNNVVQYQLIESALHGAPDMPAALANDKRYNITETVEAVLYFVTAVPFFMWIYRAYKNLPALGASHLDHSAGMAIGWWFVPFANLVKPYNVVEEIWRNSNPAGFGIYARRSSTALVGIWWALYLIRNIGQYFWSMMATSAVSGVPNVQALLNVSIGGALCHLVSLAAAAMAIVVIRRITSMQDERYEAVTQAAIPTAQPV